MAHINSIDDFLRHSQRDRSGGFLSREWKKGNPAEIDVWFHRQLYPMSLWQHSMPTVTVRKDPDTGAPRKVVLSKTYTCREDENTLRKQRVRTEEGGRKLPPSRCGICRFIEYVYRAVHEGRITPWTPVLRFAGDSDSQTITAGGMYMSRKDIEDLLPEERAAAQKAGVSFKDFWREAMLPRGNYLFAVVDNAAPADGVQLAIEPAIL